MQQTQERRTQNDETQNRLAICGGVHTRQLRQGSVAAGYDDVGGVSVATVQRSVPGSSLRNTRRAMFPVALQVVASTMPPTTPATTGTTRMMFTTPFSPAFVTRRKPTRLLISIRSRPGICLMT